MNAHFNKFTGHAFKSLILEIWLYLKKTGKTAIICLPVSMYRIYNLIPYQIYISRHIKMTLISNTCSCDM